MRNEPLPHNMSQACQGRRTEGGTWRSAQRYGTSILRPIPSRCRDRVQPQLRGAASWPGPERACHARDGGRPESAGDWT